MEPFKIAISGKARSGKNTVASLLCTDFFKLNSEQYAVIAFADKIKLMILEMFPGCDRNSLFGPSELRQNSIRSELDSHIHLNISYREISILLGKLGRSCNPAFWVAHFAREFENLKKIKQLIICSDLRFIEEFEWLKQNGFVLCRVKRKDSMTIDDVSETEQDQIGDNMFDVVINNNGSIEELYQEITTKFSTLSQNNTVSF